MSDSILAGVIISISVLFGFISGSFFMAEHYEDTAIKAGVAYYDPVTAEFKYQNFDEWLTNQEENKDENN